jgi:hypothetical protein
VGLARGCPRVPNSLSQSCTPWAADFEAINVTSSEHHVRGMYAGQQVSEILERIFLRHIELGASRLRVTRVRIHTPDRHARTFPFLRKYHRYAHNSFLHNQFRTSIQNALRIRRIR